MIFPIIRDEEFERGKVPMTKSAIRDLSIVRLNLSDGDVVFDIGSGTGSIAVQIAGLSKSLKVYALEKKQEAIELIKTNKEKFGAENIVVVEGDASETISSLEKPDKVFIGGSGGKLNNLLETLLEMNPKVHIVMNAISLETLSEITNISKELPLKNLEIEQIAYSRAKEVGNYHMMMAENPVYIISFDFENQGKL